MYYIQEKDIISLQILLVLNLANIFIMFFSIFIKMENDFNNRRGITHNYSNNDNVLNYIINYDDLYTEVFSDDFPFENLCSICLIDFDFSSNLTIVKTIHCNHCFHENCLKTWLRIKPTCPNCNTNIAARMIEHY
jgi:hypothetical protein